MTDGKVWDDGMQKFDKSIQSVPSEFKIKNESVAEIFKRRNLTVLAVSYSTFSDSAVDSFISQVPPEIPKLIVRPVLNPLKWILWSKFINSENDSVVIFGDVPGSIDVFGMENKFAGYVFLIDKMGIIRWRAAGRATEDELKEFLKVIKTLSA